MNPGYDTVGFMADTKIPKSRAICPIVLDRVGNARSPVPVTRTGGPDAEAVPARDWLGAMKIQGEIHGDLIAPAVDLSDWESFAWEGLPLDTRLRRWNLPDPDSLFNGSRRCPS